MSEFVVGGPVRVADVVPGNRTLHLCLTLVITLAVVLSATGACDTDDLNLVHRTTLWLVVCALVVSQAVVLHRWACRHIGSSYIAGALAVIVTVVLISFETHLMKYTPFLPKEPDPPLEFFLFILPLAGPVALLALLFVGRPRHNEIPTHRLDTTAEIDQAETDEAELASWPDAQVLRVAAEDHYLSVVTASGSVLIRGRMKDALRMLANRHGVQVHRSHWVGIDEIRRVSRKGRDYRMHLVDGTTVPVSRSRVASLKQRLAHKDLFS